MDYQQYHCHRGRRTVPATATCKNRSPAPTVYSHPDTGLSNYVYVYIYTYAFGYAYAQINTTYLYDHRRAVLIRADQYPYERPHTAPRPIGRRHTRRRKQARAIPPTSRGNTHHCAYDAITPTTSAAPHPASTYHYDGSPTSPATAPQEPSPSTTSAPGAIAHSTCEYNYVHSRVGSWPSRDPIEEDGGLNLYAMVGNNAVGWTDALGLVGDAALDAFDRRQREGTEPSEIEHLLPFLPLGDQTKCGSSGRLV